MRAGYKRRVARPEVLCHAYKHGGQIQTVITSPSAPWVKILAGEKNARCALIDGDSQDPSNSRQFLADRAIWR